MSSKKGVLQECHLSVSRQGVPQAGSLENVINKYRFCSSTYVWHSGSWASSCFYNASFPDLLDASGARFDLIVACNVLCRLPSPRDFLALLPASLAPGGVVVWLGSFSWKIEPFQLHSQLAPVGPIFGQT